MKSCTRIWTSIAYLALAAVTAQAEIVYTPVNIAIPLNTQYNMDLNGDGVTDFVLQSKVFQVLCQSGDGYSWTVSAPPAQPNNGVVGFGSALGWFDSALPTGVQVGSNQTFYQGFAAMSEFKWGNCGTVVYGQWLNVPDRYLGLKFQILRNGVYETHYGWAKVTVAGYLDQYGHLQSATFLSGFAYETVPGTAIITGQMSGNNPTTSDSPTGLPVPDTTELPSGSTTGNLAARK